MTAAKKASYALFGALLVAVVFLRMGNVAIKGFFQILVGVFIALSCFLRNSQAGPRPNLSDEVGREFGQRIKLFMSGFEKVMGAQVLISLINTAITAIFLLAMGMPYVHFLTL